LNPRTLGLSADALRKAYAPRAAPFATQGAKLGLAGEEPGRIDRPQQRSLALRRALAPPRIVWLVADQDDELPAGRFRRLERAIEQRFADALAANTGSTISGPISSAGAPPMAIGVIAEAPTRSVPTRATKLSSGSAGVVSRMR
jgi:hypothetical protein